MFLLGKDKNYSSASGEGVKWEPIVMRKGKFLSHHKGFSMFVCFNPRVLKREQKIQLSTIKTYIWGNWCLVFNSGICSLLIVKVRRWTIPGREWTEITHLTLLLGGHFWTNEIDMVHQQWKITDCLKKSAIWVLC